MKISAVIPSCNTSWDTIITLGHLASQNRRPDNVIVVMDGEGESIQKGRLNGMEVIIYYTRKRGAAAKRNLGIARVSHDNILLADDDVEPKPGCLGVMEAALESSSEIGGVGSFIENQRFQEPGLYSRLVWRLTGGAGIADLSGRCFGPMITTYPRFHPGGAPVQEVEWLNSGFTLYRLEVLPDPPFDKHFTGYSFMEDVALSRRVRKHHRLVVARDAWIVHHSRPASYKNDAAKVAHMAVTNRHHILTQIEGWSPRKAARGCAWLEFLMLPVRFKHAILHHGGWSSIVGTARGLAEVRGTK